MAEPVVMYGIGATKAGTSWLYRYLAAHPDGYLRSIKELHFFDSHEKGIREGAVTLEVLENGLGAFRSLEDTEYFIETIYRREWDSMEKMFAGAGQPFGY